MRRVTVTYERETPIPEWATPAVILAMHEVDGKTFREMEGVLGVSRTTIGKIITRAKADRASSQ
jgi:predicted transcriptional regulator